MLETGKSYKFRLDISQGKKIKFHVDYLLDNVIDSDIEYTLIVGRIWIRNKWKILIYQAWELYLYNREEKKLQDYKISLY